MLCVLYRLVDDRPECKTAGGAAGTPIKDVLGYPFNRSQGRSCGHGSSSCPGEVLSGA